MPIEGFSMTYNDIDRRNCPCLIYRFFITILLLSQLILVFIKNVMTNEKEVFFDGSKSVVCDGCVFSGQRHSGYYGSDHDDNRLF